MPWGHLEVKEVAIKLSSPLQAQILLSALEKDSCVYSFKKKYIKY